MKLGSYSTFNLNTTAASMAIISSGNFTGTHTGYMDDL